MSFSSKEETLINFLLSYYKNKVTILKDIINQNTPLSLRLLDWLVTNYAKKYYTLYNIDTENGKQRRFKVYVDYKLKLKAYSKKRFDPFCRWDRINIPYKDGNFIQTTIGQLNFFKWALENNVIEYIRDNYENIEKDMNSRNSSSRKKDSHVPDSSTKTRKRREELSILASKSIKKEEVEIVVKFN